MRREAGNQDTSQKIQQREENLPDNSHDGKECQGSENRMSLDRCSLSLQARAALPGRQRQSRGILEDDLWLSGIGLKGFLLLLGRSLQYRL